MPRDLDALRAEMKAQADETARRFDAELARLKKELEAERAAREAERAEARVEAEATRKAVSDSTVWHAGRFGLSLGGFAQVDAVAWRQSSQDEVNPSTGDPLNQTRFLLRRARLRAEINYRIIAGAIEIDANTVNGSQVRPVGAEASLVWRNPDAPAVPYLMVTLGLFKTPFGFEIGQSDKDRLFLERSNLERALFPGEYDLGARLQGGWKFLRYQIGAMNGDPIGEKLFPGRDPNQSKDLVGRIGIDTIFLHRLGLKAGFSADYGNGFHKGIAASKDTLVWRDANEDGAVQLNEIQVIAGQTPTPSSNFQRWAVAGDLLLAIGLPKLGELTVYGELTYATNLDRATQISDPVSAGRDVRQLGWYVAFTQELTPYGMIGVRYDSYDADRDSNGLKGGVQVPNSSVYSTLAVAGAIRYPGYARLQLEYQHNGNPLGRNKNGLPTTLADDAFIIRGQVQF